MHYQNPQTRFERDFRHKDSVRPLKRSEKLLFSSKLQVEILNSIKLIEKILLISGNWDLNVRVSSCACQSE